MTPKTIALYGEYIRKEGNADAAVTPGHLVERTVTGYKVHSTADGNAQRTFALENDLVGKTIDDAYAAGETVQVGAFENGAGVYALLADAVVTTVDAPLASNGDGTLKLWAAAATPPTENIVAYAKEALTASGVTRIRVEVA